MFPFDQPAPTAFYLVLYLATLVLHVVPMNYVLAGSTCLALLSGWEAWRGRVPHAQEAIARVLRDWMPFALSVTITAGVAPLLFLQILYKESFYTANLLLFHRWMAILPVLIAAFYLLYLQKSKRLAESRPWLRLLVSLGVLVCFGFVAWSWTENHLLSTRGVEAWTAYYASGRLFYGDPELTPRLALWCLGGFPTLAVIVAWQLRRREGAAAAARPLALLAALTLAAAAGSAVFYAASLPPGVRGSVASRGWPWVAVAAVGGACQAIGWWRIGRRGVLNSAMLLTATLGAVAATVGVTVVREARRLVEIDITPLYEAHAQAGRVGGLGVFLGFAVLNAALILVVVVLVRRGGRAAINESAPDR